MLYHRRGFQSNEKTLTFDLAPTLIMLQHLDQPFLPEHQTVGDRPLPINNNKLTVRVHAKEPAPEEPDALKFQRPTHWLSSMMQIKYQQNSWIQLIVSLVVHCGAASDLVHKV